MARAMLPRSSEIGKVSRRISRTVRVLYTNDVPKSPRTALPRKIRNCCGRGLSRPYAAARFFCASGESGLAPSATGSSGLPGVACMTRNVTSAMAPMVGTSHRTRLTMYGNNRYLRGALGTIPAIIAFG